MVERISVAIALEGGKEVEQQLADIGKAGQKAFADISKSAEQVGGFKNLKPEDVTAKLEEMGVTGADAIKKIQGAVQTAVRFESFAQGIAAVENGFLAVAKAAGIAAVAAAGAAIALSRYISQAAKVSEELTPLADLSGQAMRSVSALQIAFAQGGTSAEKFAVAFTNLQVKVQEASRTMANAVEQSSQRIIAAHLSAEQAGIRLGEAELALAAQQHKIREEQRSGLGSIDVTAAKRLTNARAALAQDQLERNVAQARLAQQQAQHQLRVAEANDLQKIIELYQQIAAGGQAAFDPLTTQATKNAALFATLAQAGENYVFVLADILKNASALDRAEIAKALSLDPKTVDTLKQGSEALRAQQQAVQALGLALSDVDQKNLKAFSDSWAKLSATAGAALEKVAAALAPLGTLIAQGLQVGLETAIEVIGRLASEISTIINLMGQWTDANNQTAQSFDWLGAITADLAKFGESIMQNIEILKQMLGLGSSAGAATSGGSTEGMAGGGLIGGRGSGTSDSNLAWVSRGEHIMPARAVAQPGVLAFLEALRQSGGNLARVLDGMGRFVLGGLVPRPIPAFAVGGLVSGMSNVTIAFPGLPAIGGLRASSEVIGELQRAAALAQVRSGGRKPSRYS